MRATRLLNGEGVTDCGTLSQVLSILLIGAMFLITCGMVERIAQRRLRRAQDGYGLKLPCVGNPTTAGAQAGVD